jgi:hypothetical protein
LTKKKDPVIAFLDGDRGGTIILNELLQVAKIDFIARAPDGFEVEELTRKILVKSLQSKKPAKMYNATSEKSSKGYKGKEGGLLRILDNLKVKDNSTILEAIKNITPGQSFGFNKKGEKIFDMSVGELFGSITEQKNTQFLIIDGILSSRLLSLAQKMKIKFIACKNKEQDLRIPSSISTYYL